MRQLTSILTLLTLCSNAMADICPSVQSLKNNKVSHWQAFDSDNGKPLTPIREARLKHQITQFALAEWSSKQDKNRIHCYYKNQNGSDLEAYFARNSTVQVKPSRYWYEVTGMMQCAAGADKCQFQALPEMQHRLAQNDANTPADQVID